MAPARTPVLRHLLSCQTRTLRASNQRRWAQVHDVRFLATTQQPRSVLERYRDKLDRKAREEGHADIDSLKAAYADKIKALRQDAVVPPPPPPPAARRRLPNRKQHPSNNNNNNNNNNHHHHKHLTQPLQNRPPNPNSLCAVIPAATFATMNALARAHPQFVLPVPHPQQGGAEMHFLQWTWDAPTRSATVLFTRLAEYKARGEFAAPHTTATHYYGDELATSAAGAAGGGKGGVVLMQGAVVADRGVKVEEARWLVMCLQRFYGGWDGVESRERAEERRRLLEWFGKGDARFSVEKLMEEAERMG
ncbi:c06a9094-70e3-4bf3-8c36-6cb6fc206e46 [Thermothielavioides terrestris]|uniref:C06a9094-70e3-4bf3-8c36-6cb6fc206e46 n=1 Tax=Thermothielavioides terrestris TaxID=2587410 RepID=A0A3S4AIN9_9PEZI|nr:c06a9094-70e3-4bf3-8c36-6cb6fc206e46 [Thermothielavioides terrestris]